PFPKEPATRAASRATTDAPLRGRLEVPLVRSPRGPDHCRGAAVHADRLAPRPARAARALLSVRRVRFLVSHVLSVPPQPAAYCSLADPALLAFLVAGGLLAAAQLTAPTQTVRSFAWALIPTFVGLSTVRPGSPGFTTFYLATGALILIVAVVEASYHMAYLDSLTGLPARRALNEALLRLGGHYAVAMLDVDHFKRINDQHGHDVGDQVLKMIAA